ncbi:MAG: YfhO family protein [Clostridium sp.]|uniref:YfhO family protein n=1 Tax=Clostridium sp. TaxID=1506 RepID=UPI003EE62960
MRSKRRKYIIYVLAFLIPVSILIVDYYFIGIFPFGNKTILYRDLQGQYVSYFSEFRNAILGNGGLLYSFTKGIGGNMIGILTYYLMSPFNSIVLIFPKNMLTEAILLITILKIGMCGITFNYFLRYTFKENKYKSLIFSTAYSLIGFVVVYQSNIMWLDGVYLLPLVMVGINKIVNNKRKRMYVITLSLAIITNFYIGFMICIFSVLYFIYLIVYKMYEEKKGGKYILGRVRTFLCCSIISGIASAITIIPTIYALQGGKSEFDFFKVKLGTEFSIISFLSKFYVNRMNDDKILNGLPSVYSGLFITVLVFLFFLNRRIKIFEKIMAFVMFLILFLSLYINKVNYIWHGFNKPAGFPYRFTFIFSFFMIFIAYKSFKQVKGINLINSGIVVVVFFFTTIFFYKRNYYHSPRYLMVTSFILVLIYCIGLLLVSKGVDENVILILIAVISFAELGLNGYSTFSNLPYTNRSEFEYYLQNVGAVMSEIENTDKGFYRLEKNFYFNINDPMLLNYRGISHFSSVYKVSTRKFINGMGFLDNNVWTIYDSGSMLTANSLLNLKYVLSKEKKYIPGYIYVGESKGLYIYENQYYLDLGFMVNSKALDVNVIGNNNPFENQNELLQKMSNTNLKSYYRINNFKIELNNVAQVKNGQKRVFTKKDKNKNASFVISFNAQNDYPMYLFLQTDERYAANIYVNGKFLTPYSYYNYKVSGIGKFKEGKRIKIKVELENNKFVIDNNELYYLNLDNYNEIHNILKKKKLNITSFTNRVLEGTIDVRNDNEVLYTTIPYNKGWKVYVNGKPYNYEEGLGAITTLKLNKGVYNIKFDFKPEGLYSGISISAVITILCILYIGLKKEKFKYNETHKKH